MVLILVILAAALSAFFNGSAVILEKIGVDQQAKIKSAHPNILWQLRSNIPYIVGLVLDFFSWLLALYAVQRLPLFVVQPIIACSVIFTVLIEHYLFKKRLSLKFGLYLITIVLGLIMIALVAEPEKAIFIQHSLRWVIILSPILLTIIGLYFAKIQKQYAAFFLAGITGLAFGGIAIAGRALVFHHNLINLFFHPLIWAIIGYGLLGILFLTIALQRASASAINATVIVCETIIPIIFGLVFFGDHPKHHLWYVVILGIILTISGTILITLKSSDNEVT